MKVSNGKFKVVTFNINGIRSLTKKGISIASLAHKYDADVVCLQETRIPSEQLTDPMRNIDGYTSVFVENVVKKGNSGVAMFVKNCCPSTAILTQVFTGDDVSMNEEGRVILSTHGDITIITCYFPNIGMGGDRVEVKARFCASIQRLAEQQRNEFHRSVIIVGDVNIAHHDIDVYNPSIARGHACCTVQERKWLTDMLELGYVDALRAKYPDSANKYTYFFAGHPRSADIGWRLDYFLISPDLKDNIVDVIIDKNQLGSDHCPVVLELNRRPFYANGVPAVAARPVFFSKKKRTVAPDGVADMPTAAKKQQVIVDE